MTISPPRWHETLSGSLDETFKISELTEKFNITVSSEDLQEYRDAVFSMTEVEKIKTWISSISELATIQLDILKENLGKEEAVRRSQERLYALSAEGEEASVESQKEASDIMNQFSSSTVWSKAKELSSQAKWVINEWVETVKAWGFMIMLENTEKKWGFLGFLAGLLLSVMKIFGMWNKVGELKGKISEKLSNLRKMNEVAKEKRYVW